MRSTAVATARSHCGAVRLPSCQRIRPGGAGGATGRGSRGPPGGPGDAGRAGGWPVIEVSHAWPERRPSITWGRMRTDPSEVGSKVKLPKATGPQPGAPTRSSTCAPSSRARSHLSAAVKRSWPAGTVTRATSPQPTRPSPRRIQASVPGPGSWPTRSPGSATGTVRTTSPSGSGKPARPEPDPTAANCTCHQEPPRPRGAPRARCGPAGAGLVTGCGTAARAARPRPGRRAGRRAGWATTCAGRCPG